MTERCEILRASISSVRLQESPVASWLTGCIITPHGIVSAFSGHKHTSLTFSRKGRIYTRTFDKECSAAAMTRLAVKLAHDKTLKK